MKKKFVAPVLEHEKKMLDKAKLKLFKPTLAVIEKIALGGNFSISLAYKPLKSDMAAQEFPLELINSREPGLTFKIIVKDDLDIGGVLHKENYGLSKPLAIRDNEERLYADEGSVISFKTVYPARPQILEGRLTNLKTFEKDVDKTFIRLVVHTSDTDMTYPSEILEFTDNHMKFDYPAWDRQRSLIGFYFMSTKGMFADLTINNYKFDFYAVENMNSLIIDSCDLIPLDDFKTYSYVIRLAFAFLSGKFYRDELVYLSSSTEDFAKIDHYEYVLEPHSIISGSQIINPTFFFETFPTLTPEEQEDLKKFHNMFEVRVFSTLCEKLLESPELLRCVELLVNSGNIKDPVQKGAMNSVAIETLTEYLKDLNEADFKPISDKAVWKEFLKAQQELLDQFKGSIDQTGMKILNTKIENLNSPTNRDKLLKPFTLYGLKLSPEEIETLDQRNKYLHGGAPSDTKWVAEQNMMALKLHNLTAVLILKFAGYSGHTINLAAWHIMHLSETHKLMEDFDIKEIAVIKAKIEQGGLDLESIKKARDYMEDYEKYLKSIIEIHNIIKVIE